MISTTLGEARIKKGIIYFQSMTYTVAEYFRNLVDLGLIYPLKGDNSDLFQMNQDLSR